MWISVQQIIPEGYQWNDLNTDLIERVRPNPEGGLIFCLQSGFEVVVTQDRDWWESQKSGASK